MTCLSCTFVSSGAARGEPIEWQVAAAGRSLLVRARAARAGERVMSELLVGRCSCVELCLLLSNGLMASPVTTHPLLQEYSCKWPFIFSGSRSCARYLILSPTTSLKIQDTFHVWVTLQIKCSILIFCLLQQQDTKENPFYKWVFRREDTHIYVVPLLKPKMNLAYRYSVESWYSTIHDPFWV